MADVARNDAGAIELEPKERSEEKDDSGVIVQAVSISVYSVTPKWNAIVGKDGGLTEDK